MNRLGDSEKEKQPNQLFDHYFRAKLRTWLFSTDPLKPHLLQVKGLEPARNTKVLGNCESVRLPEIVFNTTMSMHFYVGMFITIENKHCNQRPAELAYQSNPYQRQAGRTPERGLPYGVFTDCGLVESMRAAVPRSG